MIVASVSCIYGLGSPEAYYGMLLMLEKGQKIPRKELLAGWSRSCTNATTAISGAAPSAFAATWWSVSDVRRLCVPDRVLGR